MEHIASNCQQSENENTIDENISISEKIRAEIWECLLQYETGTSSDVVSKNKINDKNDESKELSVSVSIKNSINDLINNDNELKFNSEIINDSNELVIEPLSENSKCIDSELNGQFAWGAENVNQDTEWPEKLDIGEVSELHNGIYWWDAKIRQQFCSSPNEEIPDFVPTISVGGIGGANPDTVDTINVKPIEPVSVTSNPTDYQYTHSLTMIEPTSDIHSILGQSEQNNHLRIIEPTLLPQQHTFYDSNTLSNRKYSYKQRKRNGFKQNYQRSSAHQDISSNSQLAQEISNAVNAGLIPANILNQPLTTEVLSEIKQGLINMQVIYMYNQNSLSFIYLCI